MAHPEKVEVMESDKLNETANQPRTFSVNKHNSKHGNYTEKRLIF